MSIKVIGAGFPRTGTNSLKLALEMIGYGKAYHFKELLNNPDDLNYWTTLRDTKNTDWDALYDGYQSSVDFPCFPWYKEHLKKYPNAKVILSTRAFEGWYESVKNTIYVAGPKTQLQKLKLKLRLLSDKRLRKVMSCRMFVKHYLWKILFQDRFEDKEFVRKIWEEHHRDVNEYVPKAQLLIYDLREGWEPLCNFLGVKIPSTSLPHLNKKEDFNEMMKSLLSGSKV